MRNAETDVVIEPAIALASHVQIPRRVAGESIAGSMHEIRQHGLILTMILP
jgi:hypothetical protein